MRFYQLRGTRGYLVHIPKKGERPTLWCSFLYKKRELEVAEEITPLLPKLIERDKTENTDKKGLVRSMERGQDFMWHGRGGRIHGTLSMIPILK